MTEQSITCPRCGRTSYNPNDVEQGYCGACHDWTGAEMNQQRIELSDQDLSVLILGWLRGACEREDLFPLHVRGFAEVYDEGGDVEAFCIITRSGLRYRVSVALEPTEEVAGESS